MKKKRGQAHNHPEMTPQELARCRPASEVDRLGLPIPTHLVSNEEYFPPLRQTSHQKQVEARVPLSDGHHRWNCRARVWKANVATKFQNARDGSLLLSDAELMERPG